MLTVDHVAELIAGKGNGSKGTHMLFVKDGELVLEKRTQIPLAKTSFIKISQRQMHEGMNSNEWEKIEKWLKTKDATPGMPAAQANTTIKKSLENTN